MELNSLFKEINRLRNGIKVVVTSGQDLTQHFPIRGKELNENLKPGVMVHAYNSCPPEAEGGGSLSLKPA